MSAEQFYKVLRADGCTTFGRPGWHLPTDDGPGEWMPPIEGPLLPCENGYHVCLARDLLEWATSDCHVFSVEISGEAIDAGRKHVVRRVRLIRRMEWDERIACLFSADCIEHVLPIFERERPGDDRPRKAIEAARAYMRGKVSPKALMHAAKKARAAAVIEVAGDIFARSACRSAVDIARSAAAVGAAAVGSEGTCAWAVSRVGIRAVRAAIGAAGEAREREWQHERLRQYLAGELAT